MNNSVDYLKKKINSEYIKNIVFVNLKLFVVSKTILL